MTRGWRLLGILLAVIVAGAGLMCATSSLATSHHNAEKRPPKPIERTFIAALGRIEPRSRLLKLGPGSAMEGAVISELLVREGDEVEAGAVLARLDPFERRSAAATEAELRVQTTIAKLSQVRAGAKPGDIAAQQALVARWTQSVETLRADLGRAESLFGKNVIPAADYERQKLEFVTARETLEAARQTLDALKEVREVDVLLAQAEVNEARAAATRAMAEREAAVVRAPVTGQVLRIHAYPGERVSSEGVLEMGDTAAMHVVAEVYEADVNLVKKGAATHVLLRSANLELMGKVIEPGYFIGRKTILNNDPVSDADARVQEVRIVLDAPSSEQAKTFTNARVEVRIEFP